MISFKERIQQAKKQNEKFQNELTRRKANKKLRRYEEKSAGRIARSLSKAIKFFLNDDLDEKDEHSSRLLNLLNKQKVLNAVRTSFDILAGLKIPQTTIDVIIETLTILRGIAYEVCMIFAFVLVHLFFSNRNSFLFVQNKPYSLQDPNLELPKGAYVKHFVKTQLIQYINEIKRAQLEKTVVNLTDENGKKQTLLEVLNKIFHLLFRFLITNLLF